ncbi:hypothetical protein QVD17_25622 [Tagetes erecta]|uniref:F-box domain-containing protein n=1 Tax=Tagetes erecta TaxID=13708 RepID=A0AAD8NVH3_TARER|nr:hypothetical protein QVD17_25622 [Tagetes erecta]
MSCGSIGGIQGVKVGNQCSLDLNLRPLLGDIGPWQSYIHLQSIKMRLKVGNSSWERFLESKYGSILDPEDSFSRMPETVLQHIVSLLPTSDINRIRFLSRKWRRLGAQVETELRLTGHKLNEVEFSKILNDEFHSVEDLFLTECLGMRNLKLVNFKLKTVYLTYCGSLKNIYLNTPNLHTLYFQGPRVRRCTFEFINCKSLRVLHLGGVSMNNMRLIDCNKSFPHLQDLSLGDCDTSGCINILSNSLKTLVLTRFKSQVDVTIDAPKLDKFEYSGSTMFSFENVNFPSLAKANIKLNPSRYQNLDETWFKRIIEMLHCLKHVETLEFNTDSVKNIIIPKELRETLVPPLDELECIKVTSSSSSTNVVDLADSMLWVSPRLKKLLYRSDPEVLVLQLTHRVRGTPNDIHAISAPHILQDAGAIHS